MLNEYQLLKSYEYAMNTNLSMVIKTQLNTNLSMGITIQWLPIFNGYMYLRIHAQYNDLWARPEP